MHMRTSSCRSDRYDPYIRCRRPYDTTQFVVMYLEGQFLQCRIGWQLAMTSKGRRIINDDTDPYDYMVWTPLGCGDSRKGTRMDTFFLYGRRVLIIASPIYDNILQVGHAQDLRKLTKLFFIVKERFASLQTLHESDIFRHVDLTGRPR